MIVGKNIILRPLKSDDLYRTHLWRNNLELIKLTQGIRFPKTLDMDKEWFDNALNDKSNKNIYFGVDEILTNEFIGIVQLNNIDYVSGTALLGFVIGDTKFRGKGYGFEFSCLIVSYAFLTLNLRKIITYNLASNDSTLSMQKKLGFLQEGELKEHIYHDGKFYDVIILSLLRNKYLEIND